MPRRGSLLILGMFLLALCATGGGLWYRYSETRLTLEWWGPQAAALVSGAERVEALRLAPADGSQADLWADGRWLRIVARRDVTTAPGFINARQALLVDRSFRWDPDACRGAWTHALRFTRGSQSVTVVLSFDCSQATLSGSDRRVGIGPIAAGLEDLLRSQFADAQ